MNDPCVSCGEDRDLIPPPRCNHPSNHISPTHLLEADQARQLAAALAAADYANRLADELNIATTPGNTFLTTDFLTPADLTALKAEHHRLIHSWAYAFAMAHGCSMGPSGDGDRLVVQREQDLRALISEAAA